MSQVALNASLSGEVHRSGVGDEAFATMRGGAGTGHDNTSAQADIVFLRDGGNTDTYNFLVRGYFLFPTSGLIPANATISSVTLTCTGYAVTNALGGSAEIVSAIPTSDSSLVNGDYALSHFGSTKLATGINFTSLNAAGTSTFTFNASGISLVQTAVTAQDLVRIGMMSNFDVDNSAPAYVSTNSSSGWSIYQVPQADSSIPKLTITYTAPTSGASFLTKMIGL